MFLCFLYLQLYLYVNLSIFTLPAILSNPKQSISNPYSFYSFPSPLASALLSTSASPRFVLTPIPGARLISIVSPLDSETSVSTICVCMDVCMDGCMDVCMYGWMYVCMDVCMDVWICK